MCVRVVRVRVTIIVFVVRVAFFLDKKNKKTTDTENRTTGTARATSHRSSTMETTAKHFDVLVALTDVVPMCPACFHRRATCDGTWSFFFKLFFDHATLSMQERYMCASTHVLYSLCFK